MKTSQENQDDEKTRPQVRANRIDQNKLRLVRRDERKSR